MQLEQYRNCLRAAHNGMFPLNEDQCRGVEHDFHTPLWMIAGPGTGKTHTLIWLVMKRLLVDEIPPDRVVLTTFTNKAAAELQSRLVLARQVLANAGCAEATDINLSQLHVGTLHSLCSQLLQDTRYEPTLRIRLLEDELTQQFFLRKTRNPVIDCDDPALWEYFGVRSGYGNGSNRYAPNRARRAEGAAKLFNRLTENGITAERLLCSDHAYMQQLGNGYQAYQERLQERHRTDQAHLQRHFLNYLQSPEGQSWVEQGLTILVDEYQDTNPIQEEIYFALAGKRGDLTVVGDDDQSLYRFRGATVESLIEFDRTCKHYLGKAPTAIYLTENRRSHPAIVAWVNRFIQQHPDMISESVRVRAPGKPQLKAASAITGEYPAIMAIVERQHVLAARKMHDLIDALMVNGYLTDYAQIALLTFSTRETSHSIGAYVQILRDAGIPVVNPRNHRAHKDPRIKEILGALSILLNPQFGASQRERISQPVIRYIEECRAAYTNLVTSGAYDNLDAYVRRSAQAIANAKLREDGKSTWLVRHGGREVRLSGLFYKLLAHRPFASAMTDPETGERLKALNTILTDYESIYDDGRLRLAADPCVPGKACIAPDVLHSFYAVFLEGISNGLNDPEDDEVSIQPGAINVMTIHQAKGLEFEVVFVLRPDRFPFLGDTHLHEDLLSPYIERPLKPARREPELRAHEDAIRLFFVAYSRAKRLLVLTGTDIEKWELVLGRDGAGSKINSVEALRRLGVVCL